MFAGALLRLSALFRASVLLRASVLRSNKVVSTFAGDFFKPVESPFDSIGRSPVLREVEVAPNDGTMGAMGLELGIGFWAVDFEDEVPKELSFRKTGAGCLVEGFSGATWKLGMSAGDLGVSKVWTLMSLVDRSSRRSMIRGRGRFRNGSRIGFAEKFSTSSVDSDNCSTVSSPERKTRFVNDLRGMSRPPRFDAGVALIAGFPVRAALPAGFEFDGAFAFFGGAAGLSSDASSFLVKILENGFTKDGFLTGSASAPASSLWLKQFDGEKQNDRQAIAKRFVFKLLFEKHISLSPSEHKSSYKISFGFIGWERMLK